MSADSDLKAIEHFNRYFLRDFCTRGRSTSLVQDSLELKILNEIAATPNVTAKELSVRLFVDSGALSRKLRQLTGNRLVKRNRSNTDKRLYFLSLTASGTKRQKLMDQTSTDAIRLTLRRLSDGEQERLVGAMTEMHDILENKTPFAVIFRQLRHGDAGWIIHRTAQIKSQDQQWNIVEEADWARSMAEFIGNYRADKDRSFIAERANVVIGAIFLKRIDDEAAVISMLFLEPSDFRIRLAEKLLDKAISFALTANYKTIFIAERWIDEEIKSVFLAKSTQLQVRVNIVANLDGWELIQS